MSSTDTKIASMVAKTDRFREAVRNAINETVVDSRSNCAEAARRGLRRIAETLDAVPSETVYNLATLDAATKGIVMQAVEVHLMAIGGGPTLDYADATAFLAMFEPMIDMALKRRFN